MYSHIPARQNHSALTAPHAAFEKVMLLHKLRLQYESHRTLWLATEPVAVMLDMRSQWVVADKFLADNQTVLASLDPDFVAAAVAAIAELVKLTPAAGAGGWQHLDPRLRATQDRVATEVVLLSARAKLIAIRREISFVNRSRIGHVLALAGVTSK